MGASAVPGNRASNLTRRRLLGNRFWQGVLGLFGEVEEVGAFHAIPIAIGNVVETNTVGVVGRIATVTQQEYIFSFGRIADGTGVGFVVFLLRVLTEPLLDIKLGDLFLVFDRIRRNGGAC